ncbi:LysM peptidoglycan-binding domain-containing protein, partial [Streptomyces sp. NPDC006265]|uniref:LysM peptidoglycan-binding domain-containing protein n=1 Tax=Streptomyces sp. NPDC006265 TaxID=3156740 RepID=UPI0033BDAEE7
MRNRSTAATIARALLALVALVALVAGVPAVLLGIGVLPDHVPGVGEITTALTSPDTGQLFLGAVTLIGWYGWISFVISVVLETGAALRHVRAPRIRMLGGSQQLAGALVGGILILLPAGTAMATPATAAPAASATAATASVNAGTQTETSAPASSTYRGPVHQVQDGDTLWDIAEKRLGAGIEWHRIVDANEGVRQSDGSLVTADTTVLQPGWTLRLPADASPAPTADQGGARAQTAGSQAATTETHTVRAGETLTGIAQDELGDADAYPRIVDANKGVKQDDGRALGDPDEIYPGWKLQIRTAAGSDRSDSKPDEAQPPSEQPADQGKTEGRPGAEQTQPPAQNNPGQGADNNKEKGETAQTPGGQGADKDRQDSGQPTARPDTPTEQPAAQSPAPDLEGEQHGTPTQAPEAHETAEAGDSGDTSVRTIAAAGSILAAAV